MMCWLNVDFPAPFNPDNHQRSPYLTFQFKSDIKFLVSVAFRILKYRAVMISVPMSGGWLFPGLLFHHTCNISSSDGNVVSYHGSSYKPVISSACRANCLGVIKPNSNGSYPAHSNNNCFPVRRDRFSVVLGNPELGWRTNVIRDILLCISSGRCVNNTICVVFGLCAPWCVTTDLTLTPWTNISDFWNPVMVLVIIPSNVCREGASNPSKALSSINRLGFCPMARMSNSLRISPVLKVVISWVSNEYKPNRTTKYCKPWLNCPPPIGLVNTDQTVVGLVDALASSNNSWWDSNET